MEWGSFNLKMREREGWGFYAPISYWEATEEQILARTGGCGPGKFGDSLVPDSALGESLFLSCQIHDWMWADCKDKYDKKVTDRIFLLNMVEQVDDDPFDDDDSDPLDLLRFRIIMTYFQAVNGVENKFI